ncbi:unnamed protein product [Medioppia subpectinata]|uniref:mitogen-activated protein kinase n=1 Tax=Medioppia subpectinata TaxID=1979941 RepID=A0A7R9L3J7_9ACAR|nr:unnamed protein product [Medioppia subpectinata]CAG2113731.1 unnamed protein product [Medioppia subpectinata]
MPLSNDDIHALAPRYTQLKYLARGSYGTVWRAVDTQTKQNVAIKRISCMDQHMKRFILETDELIHILYQRLLREIKILTHFSHENIVDIKDLRYKSGNTIPIEHVYIVQSPMQFNLATMLSMTKLSNDQIAFFTYQILRALKYIHSANVLHRDIKPANILVNNNGDLKLCEFDLARVSDPQYDHNGVHTVYVTTRWYRAPEVMLTQSCYNNSIDVWSVGCVFAEMLSGEPLFPGQHYYQQVNCILDVLGGDLDVSWITNEYIRAMIISRPVKDQVDWAQRFLKANPQALELLDRLLTFNPNLRISVDEALTDTYFELYYNPNNLRVAEHPLTIAEEVDDHLSTDQLSQMIINRINVFNAIP